MDDELTPSSAGPSWEATFAKELRRLRLDASLSLYALARDLTDKGQPFHQQQIDRIERGERTVRLNEAMALAAHFNTKLDEMIREPDDAKDEWARLNARAHEVARATQTHLEGMQRACLALVGTTKDSKSLLRRVRTSSKDVAHPPQALVVAIEALGTLTEQLAESAKAALMATAQVSSSADAKSALLTEWRATHTDQVDR